MANRLKWTPAASEDLDAIHAYYRKDSPIYASELIDDLVEQATSLLIFPKKGRVLPEIDDPSVREVFVRPYRMLYYLDGDLISIVGIVHMSRDLLNYWREHG